MDEFCPLVFAVDSEIETALNVTPRVYEASALYAILNLDWHKLVAAAQDWFADEPFSSRPAELGSYAASTGLEDFSLAVTICKNGLIANPHDHSLINNLAFSLANQGNLQEARKFLQSVSLPIPNKPVEIALKATEGLICFREGNIEAGQSLYLEAISIADRAALHNYNALASIYYAREMFLSGKFTKSTAIAFAEAVCRSSPEPHILWALNKLKETKT